ncbi:MAG: type 4a pilus biogenesis protein PilO [Planctomycetes bacterium]|nr:type 4a pilus biogenesis protein PilO [Planctomycetota bacterium]
MSTNKVGGILGGWRPHQVDAMGAAVLACIVVAGYVVGVRPTYKHMEMRAVLAGRVDAENDKASDLTTSLQSLTRSLDQTQKELHKGVPQLEAVQSLNRHLAGLTQMGTANGLRIDGLEPGKTSRSQYYDTVEIRLTGKGAYRDCTRFLSQLYRDMPDTSVTAIELAGQPGSADPSAAFTFVLSWYTTNVSKLASHE